MNAEEYLNEQDANILMTLYGAGCTKDYAERCKEALKDNMRKYGDMRVFEAGINGAYVKEKLLEAIHTIKKKYIKEKYSLDISVEGIIEALEKAFDMDLKR
jgi:hypothetical protein